MCLVFSVYWEGVGGKEGAEKRIPEKEGGGT